MADELHTPNSPESTARDEAQFLPEPGANRPTTSHITVTIDEYNDLLTRQAVYETALSAITLLATSTGHAAYRIAKNALGPES